MVMKTLEALTLATVLSLATVGSARADPYDGFRFPNKYSCQTNTKVNVSGKGTSVIETPKCGGDNYAIVSPVVYSDGKLQGPKLGAFYSFDLSNWVGTTLRGGPFLLAGTDPNFRSLSTVQAAYATLGLNHDKFLLDSRVETTLSDVVGKDKKEFVYAPGASVSYEVAKGGENNLRCGVDASKSSEAKQVDVEGVVFVGTNLGGQSAFLQTKFGKESVKLQVAIHF